MPSTLFALAVLIILIMPGIVFAIQVDNRLPTRDLSPLREFTLVAGMGVICDSFILIIFGVIRAAAPESTPDVGSIERLGTPYIRLHFVSIGWWFICLFLASCTLAFILGRYRPEIAGRVTSGDITFTSAWWELFHEHPGAYIHVGCQLEDGSYISGYLVRYSSEIDETPDRELALTAPITYRPAGDDKAGTLDDVGAVIISARQIKFLTVSYIYATPATSAINLRSTTDDMREIATADKFTFAELIGRVSRLVLRSSLPSR
jgi:hypothetical protein